MATITKNLQIFFYTGADLTLASAPWKSKVNKLFRISDSGTGWQSFVPSSNFNAVTKLTAGFFYFCDANTLPLDIDGAEINPTSSSGTVGLVSVVFQGDSLSSNYADTSVGAYGSLVAASLSDGTRWAFSGLSGTYGNMFSHPGWTTGQLLTVASEVENAFNASAAENVVVLWGGINDLALSTNPDIPAVRSNVTQLINRYNTRGYRVILCTLTSARGPSYASRHSSIDAYRLSHNTWLRQNWQGLGAACLVDLAGDYRIGAFSSGLDTTYFVDGIHMNAAGRAVVADMVRQGLISVAAGLKVVVNGTVQPGSVNGINQDVTGYTLVDNTDASITKNGTWTSTTASNLGLINGEHQYSNTVGASYSITRTCTNFKIASCQLTNGANFLVLIDGNPYGGGTCYASPPQNSAIVWESPDLQPGSHTMEVVIQDDNAKYLCLDGIYFKPSEAGGSGGTPTGVQAIAPQIGYLQVEAEDVARWTDVGEWVVGSSLPQFYIGPNNIGKTNSNSVAGDSTTVRVQTRYVDLLAPLIPGAGTIALIVKRVSSNQIVASQLWDHNAGGIEQKEGYPDDNTPQRTIDTGTLDYYDVIIKNNGGGPIGFGCIRIRQ